MGSSSSRKKKGPKISSFHNFSFKDLLHPSKADCFRLIAVVSIAAAVAVACNFIATSLNQPPRPFCDSVNLDTDDPFFDYCEPCPANGECHDGKLECVQGYRKHGKLCVEDRFFVEAAEKLSKGVEVQACNAYAQFLCSGTGKFWVSENELFSNVDEYSTMDYAQIEAIYVPAKERAMDIVHKSLETRRNNNGVEEFKCPEQLVNHYIPLNCKVRRWIVAHDVILVLSSASFMGCVLLVSWVNKKHRLSVRIEELYHEVCEILEEKVVMKRRESGESEPWVVDSWLRDHLLSSKERKDRVLWKKVEELVAEDSRIDQYPKIVKGEPTVVWEWQVEGALSSSRKRRESRGSAQKVKESVSGGIVPKLKEFFQYPKAQHRVHAD